ncbi:MAG TPA: hypothetical protein PKE30_06250 [Niabella sp.]|mgnify:CR=1 FL=1|nr:hypothetical protein [Niabella sp.]
MLHFITLDEAAAMTSRYRSNREAVLLPAHQNKNLLPLSETFDRAVIDSILAQPGCTALRIYYGMDEDLKLHAIVVAADKDNADILPVTITDDGGEGGLAENANRCPPLCPLSSPLNEP